MRLYSSVYFKIVYWMINALYQLKFFIIIMKMMIYWLETSGNTYSREGPAGATLSLVFHFSHNSFCAPVNSFWNVFIGVQFDESSCSFGLVWWFQSIHHRLYFTCKLFGNNTNILHTFKLIQKSISKVCVVNCQKSSFTVQNRYIYVYNIIIYLLNKQLK